MHCFHVVFCGFFHKPSGSLSLWKEPRNRAGEEGHEPMNAHATCKYKHKEKCCLTAQSFRHCAKNVKGELTLNVRPRRRAGWSVPTLLRHCKKEEGSRGIHLTTIAEYSIRQ